MFYNVVLVSAKPQHESAIGIAMSPPSGTCLPAPSSSYPFRLSQSPGLSSCVLQEIITGWLVYVWQCICFIATLSVRPSSPSRPVSTSLVSLSASLLCHTNRFTSIIFLEPACMHYTRYWFLTSF